MGRFRQDAFLAKGFSGFWPESGFGLPGVSKRENREVSLGPPKRSPLEGKVKLAQVVIFL